jgi:hypothetical protein
MNNNYYIIRVWIKLLHMACVSMAKEGFFLFTKRHNCIFTHLGGIMDILSSALHMTHFSSDLTENPNIEG